MKFKAGDLTKTISAAMVGAGGAEISFKLVDLIARTNLGSNLEALLDVTAVGVTMGFTAEVVRALGKGNYEPEVYWPAVLGAIALTGIEMTDISHGKNAVSLQDLGATERVECQALPPPPACFKIKPL